MTRKLESASGRDASGCGDDRGVCKAGSGGLKRKRSAMNGRAEKPKMTLRSHKNKTLDGPADIDVAALEAFRQPEEQQLPALHKLATDVLIPLTLSELDEDREQDTETFLEKWKHTAQIDDETFTCCVCIDDGDGGPNNPLIICDGPGCDVLVHAECYGLEKVPDKEEHWYCDRCLASPADVVRCPFCPSTTGAFRRVDHPFVNFVHISCAYWIPEVTIKDHIRMGDFDIDNVPPYRWNATCCMCKDPKEAASGVCLNCDAYGCRRAMHVTCAQRFDMLETEADETMSYPLFVFCHQHASQEGQPRLNGWQKWLEKRDRWLTSNAPRKTAGLLPPPPSPADTTAMPDTPSLLRESLLMARQREEEVIMPDTPSLLRETLLMARQREEEVIHQMQQDILKLHGAAETSTRASRRLLEEKICPAQAEAEKADMEAENLGRQADWITTVVRAAAKPSTGDGGPLAFADHEIFLIARDALSNLQKDQPRERKKSKKCSANSNRAKAAVAHRQGPAGGPTTEEPSGPVPP